MMARPTSWRPIRLCSWIYLLLQTLHYCHARSLCGIIDQRTAIVGDRLFFASGNYTFDDDGQPMHNTSMLYWLPLNASVDVSGPIDVSVLGTSDLPSDALSGGKDPISGGFAGTFFYDRTSLYAYAGMVGPEADGINNALWSFNTTSNAWKLVEVQGGKIAFGNNSEGVHASDPGTGYSFYTGGWEVAYNGTHNGTVKFQCFNSNVAPQWTFMTATAGIQGPDILKGAMVYLRKGQSGVLVAFGGYQTAYRGTEFAAWNWDRRPFTDIYIYDIFSNMWYMQKATGDIPDPRTEFCAGVSSAPDDSSFQITIHGGWDQLHGYAFNDVYVLSIPSFRWIKVDDSNNPDLLGDATPGRNRHKCDVWNETQLIVSGGQVNSKSNVGKFSLINENLNERCNKTYPPIKVLDTSTYTWRTQFDPSLEYTVPGAVTAIIGGNSSGGATLKSPSSGWASDDLDGIFKQTVPRNLYVYGSNSNTSSPSSPTPTGTSQNDDQATNKLSGGAIAGIVVGCVAGVAILAGALLWYRRRKASAQRTETGNVPLMEGPSWQKPELDSVNAARYELGTQPFLGHEVHGEDAPGSVRKYASPVELADSSRPAELGDQTPH
ncbi:hypothetical protein GGR54DRAFT_514111 [Hypoxylon sp. NC1633]|nr:hypothetical protein GGR54DRAFT_514111 [Hypoxylon sp. NC1633]